MTPAFRPSPEEHDETGRPVVRLPIDPPRPINAPLLSPPRPGEPCPFHPGAVIGPDGRCPYSASTEPGVVCAFGDPPRTGPYVLREEGELATEQVITRDPGDRVDHPPHYGGHDAVKVCAGCETEKPLTDFPPDNRTKDGRASKCRPCVRAIREGYYAEHPERERERRIRQREHSASWHQRNRETQIARMRWTTLARKYGVDRDDYMQMLEQQERRCAICRTSDPGRGNAFFSVDHDHVTGEVRGLLCYSCNTGVGLLGDDPDRLHAAADYLQSARWYLDRAIAREEEEQR